MDKSKVAEKRKHFPDWAAALFWAVLLHLVLLVLFRSAPAAGSSGQESSVSISPVMLNEPHNRELAHWIKLHDPALMTGTDRKLGYSSVLENSNIPQLLEDLPLPPQLSVPRSPQLPEWKAAGRVNHAPAGDVDFLQSSSSVLDDYVSIALNDDRLENILSLRKKLTDTMPATSAASPTVIYAQPTRPGIMPRLQVVRSSGDPRLDRHAISGTYRLLAKPEFAAAVGELAFIWPGTSGKEVKK